MLAAGMLGASLAIATSVALAWKWQLGMGRAAAATTALAVAPVAAAALADDPPGGAPAVVVAVCSATLALAGLVLATRFYRDPERTPPDRDDVLVSPADGEVVYVRRASAGRLPAASKHGRDHTLDELTWTPLHRGEAVAIGIALSFLDVHVARAPAAGTIVDERHHPGRFASLRRPEALLENERATIVIDHDGMPLAVVLIASRLVRRIRTFRGRGQRVALGERLGAIRFGSQVDLVIALDAPLTIAVAPGDRVVAGVTVVATTAVAAPSAAPTAAPAPARSHG